MEASRRHLVIFTRRPAYGVGKRRLAAGVGDLAALRFQRLMLAQLTRRLGRDPRWRTWLAVTPDRDAHRMGWTHTTPQGPGDLGQRLKRLMARLPAGTVVVVGADAPGVTRADIAAAFKALGSADAVFGPSPDGGYWLVGLRRAPRALDPFAAVRWSTPLALADTLANLSGQRVSMLRLAEDVDDAESYARFLRMGAPGRRTCAR